MNKLCGVLAALGLLGVASLALAPLETLIPPEAEVSVSRLALLIQPLIFVLGAVALGCWAAPKAGLEAPILTAILSRKPVRTLVGRSLRPGLLAGLVVAIILLGYDILTQSIFARAENPTISRLMAFQPPLVSKLLYGGIAEEIMTRWGVMSALVLAGLKLGLGRTGSFWAGNIFAALLFGLGHLPLLFLLLPSPPFWLIGAVIIGNVVPGLIFGILFWRRGIESAMIAHAAAHFIAAIVIAIP